MIPSTRSASIPQTLDPKPEARSQTANPSPSLTQVGEPHVARLAIKVCGKYMQGFAFVLFAWQELLEYLRPFEALLHQLSPGR